jgi:excisionase family DNA binding protein
MSKDDHALTVQEAAALLGVSEFTVRRLTKGGTLPSFRTSRGPRARIRILRSAVFSYMNGTRAAAVA